MGLEGWPRLRCPQKLPLPLPGLWTQKLLLLSTAAKKLLLCSLPRHWPWSSSLGLGSRRGLTWRRRSQPRVSELLSPNTSPLIPSALAVALEWEREGGGSLVHLQGSEWHCSPVTPPFLLTCLSTINTTNQPRGQVREPLPKGPSGMGQKSQDGPFQ